LEGLEAVLADPVYFGPDPDPPSKEATVDPNPAMRTSEFVKLKMYFSMTVSIIKVGSGAVS
jgi:hypothetical protein